MSTGRKKSVLQRGPVLRGNPLQASLKKPPPAKKLSKSSSRTTTSLEALATEQSVGAIDNLDELRGDFWPQREGADEFINEIQRLRQLGAGRELP